MNESVIWTEKYRPSGFDEIKGQQEIVSKVRAFVEQKNLPHLMFAGPAGIGKSTLALVAAKQLFGSEWRQNFLELNASDERGIDVVRVKVKDFARTKAMGNFPFKIIFLDECDALTRDAQQALRRTMENYAATCRFILACNYSSKIIDPIQSRCAMFRFRPLAKEHMLELVDFIGKKEGLKIDDSAKLALIEVSGGDCRKLENVLQSCASVADSITGEVVYSMASTAKPQEIKDMLATAVNGDFLLSRKHLLDIMLRYGLSGLDVIKQIQKEIWDLDVSARQKVFLIDKCGEIEFRLVEGSDEYLQLEALLAQICAVKNAGID